MSKPLSRWNPLFALALAAASLSGFAQEPMKSSPIAEALIPNDDKTFFETAASSGMFEVESGKLAAQRATDPKLKAFAQTMITDHTKANNELKALAKKKNVTLPTTLMGRHQEMLDELKDEKDGEEFDQAYKREMVASHKEAISLFTNASKHSKDADVKAFATKTLPTLQHHGGMAKDL